MSQGMRIRPQSAGNSTASFFWTEKAPGTKISTSQNTRDQCRLPGKILPLDTLCAANCGVHQVVDTSAASASLAQDDIGVVQAAVNGLDASALMLSIAALLCERRTVVVAQDLSVAASVLHGLLHLIRPVQWHHPVLDALSTPAPDVLHDAELLMRCDLVRVGSPGPVAAALSGAQWQAVAWHLGPELLGGTVVIMPEHNAVLTLAGCAPLPNVLHSKPAAPAPGVVHAADGRGILAYIPPSATKAWASAPWALWTRLQSQHKPTASWVRAVLDQHATPAALGAAIRACHLPAGTDAQAARQLLQCAALCSKQGLGNEAALASPPCIDGQAWLLATQTLQACGALDAGTSPQSSDGQASAPVTRAKSTSFDLLGLGGDFLASPTMSSLSPAPPTPSATPAVPRDTLRAEHALPVLASSMHLAASAAKAGAAYSAQTYAAIRAERADTPSFGELAGSPNISSTSKWQLARAAVGRQVGASRRAMQAKFSAASQPGYRAHHAVVLPASLHPLFIEGTGSQCLLRQLRYALQAAYHSSAGADAVSVIAAVRTGLWCLLCGVERFVTPSRSGDDAASFERDAWQSSASSEHLRALLAEAAHAQGVYEYAVDISESLQRGGAVPEPGQARSFLVDPMWVCLATGNSLSLRTSSTWAARDEPWPWSRLLQHATQQASTMLHAAAQVSLQALIAGATQQWTAVQPDTRGTDQPATQISAALQALLPTWHLSPGSASVDDAAAFGKAQAWMTTLRTSTSGSLKMSELSTSELATAVALASYLPHLRDHVLGTIAQRLLDCVKAEMQSIQVAPSLRAPLGRASTWQAADWRRAYRALSLLSLLLLHGHSSVRAQVGATMLPMLNALLCPSIGSLAAHAAACVRAKLGPDAGVWRAAAKSALLRGGTAKQVFARLSDGLAGDATAGSVAERTLFKERESTWTLWCTVTDAVAAQCSERAAEWPPQPDAAACAALQSVHGGRLSGVQPGSCPGTWAAPALAACSDSMGWPEVRALARVCLRWLQSDAAWLRARAICQANAPILPFLLPVQHSCASCEQAVGIASAAIPRWHSGLACWPQRERAADSASSVAKMSAQVLQLTGTSSLKALHDSLQPAGVAADTYHHAPVFVPRASSEESDGVDEVDLLQLGVAEPVHPLAVSQQQQQLTAGFAHVTSTAASGSDAWGNYDGTADW